MSMGSDPRGSVSDGKSVSDRKSGGDGEERLTWLWKVTSEEDKLIIEKNQAGVNSRFYEPGPYSQMESNPRRFTERVLRALVRNETR